MPARLKYDSLDFSVNKIYWDRDSLFVNFDEYWCRLAGTVAQRVAESTTDNWGEFNVVRTTVIKLFGINIETGIASGASILNIIPVNSLTSFIAAGIKPFLANKTLEELNLLLQPIIEKSLLECSEFIKKAILTDNIKILTSTFLGTSNFLITNDSKKNNECFLEEVKLKSFFKDSCVQINKQCLEDFLEQDSVFITRNSYLKDFYSTKNKIKVLLLENLSKLCLENSIPGGFITVNVDGASRGNPGNASIGVVFRSGDETIATLSEFIGNQTNNYAEYMALIRAMEYANQNGYTKIEILSDSELVVKQINKIYKVSSPEIKELFDKANSLIKTFAQFKIKHIPRDENALADKLANEAIDKYLNKSV